jgi:hypothetical protein
MSPRIAVAALSFIAYFALSRSVGNFFPFSTFAMYAGDRAPRASRILARDAAGAVHEIDRLRAWQCDRPVRIEHDACGGGPYAQVDYLDRAALGWIDAHRAGDGAAPFEVVRRIWRLDAGAGPPPFEDCLLARCRATP